MIFISTINKKKLFQNPFHVDINNVKNDLQMKVIELQNDEVLKSSFREAIGLPKFYSCLPISTFSGIRQFAKKTYSGICKYIYM